MDCILYRIFSLFPYLVGGLVKRLCPDGRLQDLVVPPRKQRLKKPRYNCKKAKRFPNILHTAKTQYRKFETNIPRKGIASPRSQFPHSFVCEQFIYYQDWSALFCCGKRCGPNLGIYNFAQTHECGNWAWGSTITFLGIHKWDFHWSAVFLMVVFSLQQYGVPRGWHWDFWVGQYVATTYKSYRLETIRGEAQRKRRHFIVAGG